MKNQIRIDADANAASLANIALNITVLCAIRDLIPAPAFEAMRRNAERWCRACPDESLREPAVGVVRGAFDTAEVTQG